LLLALLKGATHGAHRPMVWTVLIVNSTLDGLTTALVGRVGRSLGGWLVGAFAFFLHLLSPNLLRYGYWLWDTPFGDLAVVLLLATPGLRRDPPSRREDVLAGAGLCLAGMFSGSVLLVGPTVLLSRFLRAPRWTQAVRSCTFVILSFLVCQSPWVIRNG